jgi:hypothetical protein
MTNGLEGLLLPLNWVIDGSFWEVLLTCLIICPGIPQLFGLVFESRWVPWSPNYQFLAFIPGNPCLAVFIAACSTAYGDNPSVSSGWNQAFLVGAFVFYVVLNLMDLKSNYTREQMLSSEKWYHNALYFWYGYLAVYGWVAMLGSDESLWMKLLLTAPGLLWLACLIVDTLFIPAHINAQRLKYAHAANLPLWKTRGRIRRRTRNGFELAS